MDLVELSRRLENMIRIGTIAEIDHANRRVRVKSGELLTQWLKWRTDRAGATRTWNPPTIDEQVMILSPSGELGNGIVIPSIYSDAFDSASSDPDLHIVEYPDGARISYNHKTGDLLATGINTAAITASVSITADTPLTHCTGNVIVDGDLTVGGLFTYKGGMNGSGSSGSGGAAAVIAGDVMIGNIRFLKHLHSDNEGGTTGVPQ